MRKAVFLNWVAFLSNRGGTKVGEQLAYCLLGLTYYDV
jgi:hypothetical protein